MKITPVSGDLLVKLGIGVVLVGGVGYLIYRLTRGVKDAALAAAPYVNPADSRNIVNSAVTGIGDALVSPDGPGRNADGSWTLGGWIYDITHSGESSGPPPAPASHSSWWRYEPLGQPTMSVGGVRG